MFLLYLLLLVKRIHEYLFAMAEYLARRRPAASPSNTVAVPPGLQVHCDSLIAEFWRMSS